jgi:poly-gamma-glutamate synthesis protein (capsule biosynthesis protein)
MHDEPEFLELLKILRESDTTYAHLEMNIFEKGSYPGRPQAFSGMQADPIIADELKWAGIDLVSCAFNHTLDWGIDGMLGTNKQLDRVGLVHAGTGYNLEEAREPAYFESKAGRVAVISISSGHHPYDSASPVKAPVRGRPGVNPLRVTQKYVVKPEDLERLQAMWKYLGMSVKQPNMSGEQTFPAMAGVIAGVEGADGDNFFVAGDFGGGNTATLIFRAGDKPEIQSFVNKWDLDGNLRAIRDAKRQADLVIVAHHAAVNEGTRGNTPCKFIQPLAREFIDAGADAYICHGWHSLLGMEIYKGKLIWYGTGNFCAQQHFMQRFGSDTYEGHGFSLDALPILTPADINDSHEKHMVTWKRQPGGVVATLDVEGGEFTGMKLHPFSMGHEIDKGPVRMTGNKIDGRPMLTYGDNANRIIDFLSQLSEPFNTHIEYKDGIGVIKFK